ncbi:hypothetical protein pdam_00008003 [Pocillopora damicornis]|uniref:EGF-like domain-containing protein n=1 Tax=Pocillopora damicornis TaxID=46731 RepID=A0A3M6U4L2_POCDA|nr:hypothetical protein pdam_00008003 [Pocillopora damicornis]
MDGDTQCKSHYGEAYRRCSQLRLAFIPRKTALYTALQMAIHVYLKGFRLQMVRVADHETGALRESASIMDVRTLMGGGVIGQLTPNVLGPVGEGYSTGQGHAITLHQSTEGRTVTDQPLVNGEPATLGHVPTKRFHTERCNARCTTKILCHTTLDLCGLYCRIGSRVSRHGKVKDGTRATKDEIVFDVCIKGTRCDHLMYSRKKFDRCGKCGGKADSCKDEMGSFTEKIKHVNESAVIKKLPPGTVYAYFRKKISKSYNVLGIQDVYGNYLINVPHTYSKTIKYAGATITYKHDGMQYRDSLEIRGPTTETLKVVLLRVREETAGVDYMLERPLLLGESVENLSYQWVPISHWSTCSVTCGGGTQTRDVFCFLAQNSSVVSDEACGSLTKPASTQKCNTQACEAKWYVEEWTPCSKTCGSGIQTRKVICQQEVSSKTVVVKNSKCPAITKPVLSSKKRSCNEIDCPAEWVVDSAWSKCSTTCKPGKMTRQVVCQKIDQSGATSTVSDLECAYRPNKPVTQLACHVNIPCPAEGNSNGKGICDEVNPCKNGGICTGNSVNHPCLCQAGFTGSYCEVKRDPCESNPCVNQEICSPDVNSPLGYTCQEPSYPCDSSPCYNDGVCVNDKVDSSKYHCQCPPWITGTNCEVLSSACDSSPCVNDGYCSSDPAKPSEYKCACSEWFKGKNCEVQIFPCDSKPCVNGGSCSNDPSDISKYHCKCPKWFVGDKCQDKQTICDAANPCRNGGTCKSSLDNPAEYSCECGDWFLGKDCEVQRYPCDNKPCVNGATCSNDDQDVSLYHCHCTDGYSGKNCQVPKFREIACFNTGSSLLSDILGDFKSQVADEKQVIGACAELAFDKGYKFFALGYNGVCRSGPNARDEYHKEGATSDSNCPNGIGINKRIAVYTFELIPKQISLGCFQEKKSARLLNIKFGSFSSSYDAQDPYAMVIRCAHLARDMDYEYFAVQNSGDCRTDAKIVDNYKTYGEALPDKCQGGVGASLTNFVYRLRPAFSGPNVCDTVPCKNERTCVVHFSDPNRYRCECGDWFTGNNCEVQIYPCDSKPCLNGATCNNDPKDISKYKCKCAAWFTGTNCEVAQTICDTDKPCLNGGQCSSSSSKPHKYSCDCGDWFKGINFRLFPCDNKPCVNGATCSNDDQDVSLYHCHCTDGYSGKNCQVPTFSKIACFNTGSSFLPDILGDFKSQVENNKQQKVISACAELAFDKGYRFFALGYNSLCRSGTNVRDEYHKEGATSDNNCPNGIGVNKRIAVYTFELLPKQISLGCFKDKKSSRLLNIKFGNQIFPCDSNPCQNGATCKNDPKDISKYNCQCANWFTGINCQELLPKQISLGCFNEKKSSRLLNVKFGSFSTSYDAQNPYEMVIRCAHLARDMDYEYFAVQDFGDCRTDVKLVQNYKSYGEASPDKCQGGVGASQTNYVYRLRPAFTGPNVCDTVPCKNGGTCVVHFSDSSRYYCNCGEWFVGNNCGVQIYPCDSNPCQNGATCGNDPHNISKYKCQCADWFTGANCQVSQTICDTGKPCLNGRKCLSSTKSPEQYKCDCGDWFKGKNCEVRLFPCDNKPCVNGATCANDDQDVSLYHCNCTDGYSGKNCQVPAFSKIACFNTGSSYLSDVLGDFKSQVADKKYQVVISTCAELAFDKGYQFFALGYDGLCRSGPNARDEYHKEGATSDNNCVNGIGINKRIAVYTFELLPKQIPLGCFKEKRSSSSRLLRVKFGSFSSSYDEEDPYAMVIRCTHLARDMDYEYFAVQNFGDCRTDSKIVDNYNTYGVATPDKCLGGVGALLTNYVYRLRPAFIGSNVCDTVPCKNGGTCVVHFNDPDKYHCECGSLFAGDNCESALIK